MFHYTKLLLWPPFLKSTNEKNLYFWSQFPLLNIFAVSRCPAVECPVLNMLIFNDPLYLKPATHLTFLLG